LPRLRAEEGRCLAIAGQKAEALAILRELESLRQTEYVDAYYLALLQEALGRRDEAMRELERALDENSCVLFMVDVDPRMQSLSGAPGFSRFRARVFPDVDIPACTQALHTTVSLGAHAVTPSNGRSIPKEPSLRRRAVS